MQYLRPDSRESFPWPQASAAPPSALPGISPSRGEITRGNASASFLMPKKARRTRCRLISPLEGDRVLASDELREELKGGAETLPGRAEGGGTSAIMRGGDGLQPTVGLRPPATRETTS